ncbi:hypothetical protein Tsubulata_020036 [Turnera subulata]|uniref:Uncharacterized protein n=1 Tax=Turnera subulata TaxID=218843 RepID=A0A9Q0GKX8_9ROSI|nr:hypothetical protein Tsubulata_020036 [Turnera subulata]
MHEVLPHHHPQSLLKSCQGKKVVLCFRGTRKLYNVGGAWQDLMNVMHVYKHQNQGVVLKIMILMSCIICRKLLYAVRFIFVIRFDSYK